MVPDLASHLVVPTSEAPLSTLSSAARPAPDAPRPVTLPAAVLWDMDGTLIDTEPYWLAAETALVEAHGGEWTVADWSSLIGSSMSVAAAVLQARGVRLGVEEIAAALNGSVRAAVEAEVPWQTGALETIQALHAAGVPQALVTSSFEVLAAPFAATVGLFDVVVAGDHVDEPKPHPEPYLTAARLLGVAPEDCVAVEDSRSGLASAVASGARVVAMATHVPVEPPAGVTRASSLLDLDLATFQRIAAGEVLDLRTTG